MKVEIRNNAVNIDGYVCVVERESRIMSSPSGKKFIEKVKAKTFQKALEKNDSVDLFFNHLENRNLGNTKDNIRLWEDNIGLRAQATITDPEVIEKARNNQLSGWSFGFKDLKPNWQDGQDGIARRTLEDIQLTEVSILDKIPAYIATSWELRDGDGTVVETRITEEMQQMDNMDEESEMDNMDEGKEDKLVDYAPEELLLELLKMLGKKYDA